MESFAPEIARHWLKGQAKNSGDSNGERRDEESNAQDAALKELAERVTAARTII